MSGDCIIRSTGLPMRQSSDAGGDTVTEGEHPEADRLLGAIVRRAQGRALVDVGDLAESFGWGVRRVLEATAVLVEAGQVECWADADGVPGRFRICLSAQFAELLGLVLNDAGDRWRPKDKPKRAHRLGPRGRTVAMTDLGVDADDFEADAEADEPTSLVELAVWDGIPRPTIFLGMTPTWPTPGQERDGLPWELAAAAQRARARAERAAARDDPLRFIVKAVPSPEPDDPARTACRGCGGQKLPVDAYCLLDDRWGRTLVKPGQAEAPETAAEPAPA